MNVRPLPDIPGACYLGDVIRICPCRDALILDKHVCIMRQSTRSPRLLGRHYRILHPRAIPRRFVGTYHHPQITTSRSLNTLGRGSLRSFFLAVLSENKYRIHIYIYIFFFTERLRKVLRRFCSVGMAQRQNSLDRKCMRKYLTSLEIPIRDK